MVRGGEESGDPVSVSDATRLALGKAARVRDKGFCRKKKDRATRIELLDTAGESKRRSIQAAAKQRRASCRMQFGALAYGEKRPPGALSVSEHLQGPRRVFHL